VKSDRVLLVAVVEHVHGCLQA